MTGVHVRYYTDPACPWSWSIEPMVRRLQVEFGGSLSFTYIMGGLRDLTPAPAVASEWLEVSAASGMPVDPRGWLEDPPGSSYPACMAVRAAAEQGDPAAYLRRLREGFAFGRRRLETADALAAEARTVAGLDVDRFRIDIQSNAIVESFGADLERARAVAEERHSPDDGRVRLPSLEFEGADGAVRGVYGPEAWDAYREAAEAAGAVRPDAQLPAVPDALRRFGPMAAAEVAAVCGLPGPRASAELWRLAVEWEARVERRGTAELWAPA